MPLRPRLEPTGIRVLLAGAIAPSLLLAQSCSLSVSKGAEEHRKEILDWQQARQERLRSETGWLTLVGLFWLQEGENPFGADPANAVVLPEGTAPARAGSFVLEAGRVRIRPAADAGITLAGEPVGEREIRDDAAGEPDVLRLGRLHMTVIRRGDRLGVRVRDPESPVRKEFQGMEYYLVDSAYRIETRLVPYAPAREVLVPNVLGTQEPMPSPGYVDLDLNGEKVRLVPVLEDPSGRELFFIFGDATNGGETYGAGRFLYADLAEDGSVTVDFNKAYTPPCAFTPYATCPLPPPENRLALRIEAGEKFAGHH